MKGKYKMWEYWNTGTAIALCTAIGIVLGTLLNNVVLGLCFGAAVGVVFGAITHINRKKQ